MTIPQNEIQTLITEITENRILLDPNKVLQHYTNLGIKIIPSPFSFQIIQIIYSAIKQQKPMSVIRIGDGEANLLSYASYPTTPILNLRSAIKIIQMQQDRFHATPLWLLRIQNNILDAIINADIVGVIGLWRPQKRNTSEIIEAFYNDYRGISGHWRAIDYMLHLATHNFLDNKTITSAHLYFSILENIETLFKAAKKILIITNCIESVHLLQEKYKRNVEYIVVGLSTNLTDVTPNFLNTVKKQLPKSMKDYFCLIGAGPWSEIYCTWIKKRGGVAVDIGSGLDLLNGTGSRPIHKLVLNGNTQYYQKKYSL